KLMSGETVAEFMYSSLEKSTVTSAPLSFSDSSRRMGRRKSAGVRESLTPHQVTVPLPFVREALKTRPSCSNCHFCSAIGVPCCGHDDHVVAVVEREIEAPFEPDPVNTELAAVVGMGQQLLQAGHVEACLFGAAAMSLTRRASSATPAPLVEPLATRMEIRPPVASRANVTLGAAATFSPYLMAFSTSSEAVITAALRSCGP